jgi:hypothetical protein
VINGLRVFSVAATIALSASAAGAQTTAPSAMAPAPAAISTMPPKAPIFKVPTKPDFSSMRFLLGKWSCTAHSSRRAPTYNLVTKSVATITPDGYWMKTVTWTPKTPFYPAATVTTDWMTYDSDAGRWVDIQMGSFGGYGYTTATGWTHGLMLWTSEAFLPNGDVTSATGNLTTKVSDVKYTTAQAFTTTAGLLYHITSVCTKQ